MAGATVASATFYQEDAASPQTPAKPGSTASGDLLVYAIAQGDSTLADLTAPLGWGLVTSANGGSCSGKVWQKVATGSEPGTYDFPYHAGADVAAVMMRVTGADTTPTIVAAAGTAGPNGGSVSSGSVNPTGTDDLLISLMSAACGGATLVETDPAGMTDLGQGQVSGGFQAIAAAFEQLVSSGATGTRTWSSITPGTKPGITFTLAIKSASGGPTPVSLGDAGAAAEAMAVAASTPLADAGAAAQTLAVTVAAPLSDTASSAEAITAAAAVPLGDTGSAAQTLTAAVTTSLADAGTAVDSLVAGIAISLADAGSASEALTVTVAAALADSASAGQTLGVTATAALADSGHAADIPAVTAAVALADAAAAAESLAAGLVEPDESGGTRPRIETSSRPRTIVTSSRPSRIDTSSGGPQ